MSSGLAPAALAFDSIAATFDDRFSSWLSVAAQRRAVRAQLDRVFARHAHLLEIGGGTGDDALWAANSGRTVVMTDVSPAMIGAARRKFGDRSDLTAQCCSAEDIGGLAGRPGMAFDGAWSTFAALNCVEALDGFAAGLATLVRPGGAVMLVMFGCFCPAEIVVEAARGRPRNMLRRFRRGPVSARLGGHEFTVRYHRRRALARSMAPWFELRGSRAIGLFVPPSAAEPWISRHPRLLAAQARLDDWLAVPLAPLGDHVLFHFERASALP